MDLNKKSVVILVAEDDDDDFLLTQNAFKELNLANQIRRVKDGQELLDYLKLEGPYAKKNSHDYPKPHLVLLDLNMPIMDGREVLKIIKNDASFKSIPIVVMTTSQAEEDKIKSYELGVNSFIRKPIMHDDFIEVIRVFKRYWIEIVELPE